MALLYTQSKINGANNVKDNIKAMIMAYQIYSSARVLKLFFKCFIDFTLQFNNCTSEEYFWLILYLSQVQLRENF